MAKKLISISAIAVALVIAAGPSTATFAADEPHVINIVKNVAGKFVFDQPDVTATVGGELKWVGTHNAPHHLVPDTDKDAFTDTGQFTTPDAMPVQRFDKAGTIHYHCAIHGTMKGTITVKEATP